MVKRLNQFLLCERLETVEVKRPPYSKEQLAQLLGITVKSINKILHHQTAGRSIISKMTLPLVKLGCSTKFSTELGEEQMQYNQIQRGRKEMKRDS